MTNYIPKHTINVEIESCVSFVIDGVEIAIYEDYAESQIHIISSWANEIRHKSLFDFKMGAYCDYAEFYIEQKDWQTMLITTQFYDGTDKVEAFCDAKTVYEKIIDLIDNYFLEIGKNPKLLDIFRSKSSVRKFKNDFQVIKNFYQQHYER